MRCKAGRAKLSADADRRLFVESAGTCLWCSQPLFHDSPLSTRSVSIAERAHIVAHSPAGPRGAERAPGDERDAPGNIVLLCPTCHTIIDKDPEVAPAHVLRTRKHDRAAAVASIGGTPVFTTRRDARRAVEVILDRNEQIWRQFGPDPLDGSLPTAEAVMRWKQHVLEDIVPGNEVLVSIVAMNSHLLREGERETAELLRIHTDDLRTKHAEDRVLAPARRFPSEASRLFCEDE